MRRSDIVTQILEDAAMAQAHARRADADFLSGDTAQAALRIPLNEAIPARSLGGWLVDIKLVAGLEEQTRLACQAAAVESTIRMIAGHKVSHRVQGYGKAGLMTGAYTALRQQMHQLADAVKDYPNLATEADDATIDGLLQRIDHAMHQHLGRAKFDAEPARWTGARR